MSTPVVIILPESDVKTIAAMESRLADTHASAVSQQNELDQFRLTLKKRHAAGLSTETLRTGYRTEFARDGKSIIYYWIEED